MQIYGIKNCDTVKKSLKWLEANGIDYEFHDFKKEAISKKLVNEWFKEVPLEKLINKRGTTWRKLDDSQKNFDDINALKNLVIEQPTLLKRPLVNYNKQWNVGFNIDDWQALYLA